MPHFSVFFMTFGCLFFIEFHHPAKPLKLQQGSCDNFFLPFEASCFGIGDCGVRSRYGEDEHSVGKKVG